MNTGLFISFDGLDGTGKSTQARLLYGHLLARGEDVVLTREPGGTLGAEAIRSLILDLGQDWSPETEILLFNAARRDHMEKFIRPALARGQTVICDRFVDSTLAYQGVKDLALLDLAREIHNQIIGLWPDKTILIDLPEDIRIERLNVRGAADDALEARVRVQGHKMREIYADLIEREPSRVCQLDGRGSEADIQERVIATLGLPLEKDHPGNMPPFGN